MKIVLLDVDTITNGDVSLDPIRSLGTTLCYDMMPPDRLAGAIGDADAVVSNKAEITARIMDQCPNLRFIGVFATGYNNIDVKAASERGIVVCNVPGYSTMSVAQHVFAMILSLATSLERYNASVHNGDWIQSKHFAYFPYPLTELCGKTLGIFGYGTIGRHVAAIGRSLGMNILISTRSPEKAPEEINVPMEELFRRSDVLTFHCPLTEATRGIINRDTLALMKPTAFLINTARGGIMNEQDVADALRDGVIAGAGIDVLIHEPMLPDDPLLNAPNCILTPHIAWAPKETRDRLIDMVAENLIAWRDDHPIHTVC